MTTDSFPPTNRARLEAMFLTDAYINGSGAELLDWGGGHATRTERWHLGEDAWPEGWRSRY